MSEKQIMNGGVKFVQVTGVGGTLCVKIVDAEGAGPVLTRDFIPHDYSKPVPTQVEEYLLDKYVMGPTWFWSVPRLSTWEGQFAIASNKKVSDGFRWDE